MTHPSFDQLLFDADALARQGDWQLTWQKLAEAQGLEPGHAGVINGLGTCLLRLGRLPEAVTHFQHLVEAAPGSPEAHNNLGVAYLLAGQYAQAEAACRQALDRDREHTPAWKNLAEALLRQDRPAEGVPILAAVIRSHPHDVEALVALARCYAEVDEAESARTLYGRVLELEPAHSEAAAALAALAPAPTPPGAGTPARTGHAQKLARFRKPASPTAPPALERPAPRRGTAPARVAFYGTGEVTDGIRLGVPAAGLAARGWAARVQPGWTAGDQEWAEACVFSRPHLTPYAEQAMQACSQAGRRVIVDLDDDFHRLPADHPGYHHVGPGRPERLRALERALALADLVVVATPVLAERCRSLARRIAVVPNGWSRANPLWERPAPRRTTLNLGWAGTATHRPDVALMRAALVRIIREYPETQLVIGGDPSIYESFSSLSETRRLFIPMVPFADYPFTLAHFDLLLAPLRADAFNQAKSDIKLMEAGVRGIPWVASPLPAYQAWGAGGLFAVDADAWYEALRTLVRDPQARHQLGQAGRAQAEQRESAHIAAEWHALLQSLDLSAP